MFQDGECWNALRELHDLDLLIREQLGRDASFAEALHARARELGLLRPLGYVVRFLDAWFVTPLPPSLIEHCRPGLLSMPGAAIVTWNAARSLPPVDPDGEAGREQRLARRLMAFRAAWLRMPPWLLAYHAFRKGQRAWQARRVERTEQAEGST